MITSGGQFGPPHSNEPHVEVTERAVVGTAPALRVAHCALRPEPREEGHGRHGGTGSYSRAAASMAEVPHRSQTQPTPPCLRTFGKHRHKPVRASGILKIPHTAPPALRGWEHAGPGQRALIVTAQTGREHKGYLLEEGG
jgi:hypothetical protein